LGFAQTIVAESKGLKANWASYGAYCYNYNCQLKFVKEEGAHKMATQLALGTLPPTILPLPQPPKPSSIVTIIEGDPIYVTQPSSLPSFNLLDSTCLNFLTMANERLSSITTTL
jgi:hypothetical protein